MIPVERMARFVADAPDDTIERGLAWYGDANRFAVSLAGDLGITVKQAAGILAAVSPQLDAEGRGGVRQALFDFTRDRPDLHVMLMEPPMWLNPCGLGIVCKQSIAGRRSLIRRIFSPRQ